MERELNYLVLDGSKPATETVGIFEGKAVAVLNNQKLSLQLLDGEIELRSFRKGDESLLSTIANSKKIAQNFIGFPHPYTLEDAKGWVANNIEFTPDGMGLAILYQGALVGGIHLSVERSSGRISGIVSFWLGDNFTGKGIMQRSLEAFSEYLFTQTQIQEIRAHIFCTNGESQSLIKRLGFRQSEKSVAVEKDGETILENIFHLNQTDYQRLRYIRANRAIIEQTFLNFEDFIADFLGQKKGVYTLRLRNGKVIHLRARNEEVSDIDIVSEIFIDGDYNLEPLSGLEKPTVVDIGAQIGLFSLSAAIKLKNPNIYSYEPFPESYDLLSKNAVGNPIRHFPRAVRGKSGISNLSVSRDNVGGHSIVDVETADTVSVQTISLVDLMRENQIGQIDLLKMDCEGSEYEILFQLNDETLSKISNIYMEVHFNEAIAKKYTKYSIVDFLRKHGFQVSIIKEFYYEGEGEFYVIFASRNNLTKE